MSTFIVANLSEFFQTTKPRMAMYSIFADFGIIFADFESRKVRGLRAARININAFCCKKT
jgi:hypothetical protein